MFTFVNMLFQDDANTLVKIAKEINGNACSKVNTNLMWSLI